MKFGLEGWLRFRLSKTKDTVGNSARANKPRRSKEINTHTLVTLNSCNSVTLQGRVTGRQKEPHLAPAPAQPEVHSPDSRSSPANFHNKQSRGAVVMATGRWGRSL